MGQRQAQDVDPCFQAERNWTNVARRRPCNGRILWKDGLGIAVVITRTKPHTPKPKIYLHASDCASARALSWRSSRSTRRVTLYLAK